MKKYKLQILNKINDFENIILNLNIDYINIPVSAKHSSFQYLQS